MTAPDKDPVSRTQDLEKIVDQLGDKVAAELEAEGLPGRPSDRAQAPTLGSLNEPPD